MRQVRLLTIVAALAMAAFVFSPTLLARQAAPPAPTGLTYLVAPGGGVLIQWTHTTGTFTHYQIEASYTPGGPAFFVLATSAYAAPGDVRSKLAERLNAFTAAGVGAGTYYVHVKAVNGTVESAPSNEVAVPVSAGCGAPATPTNFTTIVRGTAGFLMWNPGSGGSPTTYVVRASFVPNDPAPSIQLPLATPYLTLAIPPGAYYVTVVAANACGVSTPSAEVLVTAPANTPDRTPDAPAGQRLPQPFVKDLVFQFAAQARSLGYLVPDVACPERPGGPYVDPLEARKVQTNPYINYIVDNLRQIDRRFGYNAKPTRAFVNSIIAGDEIAYHYGSDAPEGSPNVYLVDVLGGHCTGIVNGQGGPDRNTPDYRVFTDEFGRWTSAGRFVP
ncbi:MAG: fibronectin type III domain-containing protein [Acidobacteriota bacterium]